jgi:tRNA (guanine26-N2/guanine27-N2)-dimethyltransferase
MSGDVEVVQEKSKKSETPPGFVEITEGRAKILFPSSNEVFYNPVQEFNRDLSTLVINHFTKKVWESDRKKRKRKQACRVAKSTADTQQKEGEEQDQSGGDGKPSEGDSDGVTVTGHETDTKHKEKKLTEEVSVLEALAASGLRSIRYALEVPAVTRVVANDYSSEAYKNMCRNIGHNSVEGRVVPSCQEASMLMYEHKDPMKQFTVIDIDPYGSPSVFLDSAVQAVSDGGLLCITCTDASVLCGNHPETCYSKYGSVSLKLKCCHEMGVRIILSSLESHANRYKRYIVPLLSCSIDFYMRVFAQVFTSPAQVKRSLRYGPHTP